MVWEDSLPLYEKLGHESGSLITILSSGMRRERCSYRGVRHRRMPQIRYLGTLGSRTQKRLESSLPVMKGTLALTPEQLVTCIMEAEPPEIYLMKDLKKPFTESSVMMSLTNLADKELVLMISWAKKIPGRSHNIGVSVILCLYAHDSNGNKCMRISIYFTFPLQVGTERL